MTVAEQNRERRLRRALNKAGYSLCKARSAFGRGLGGYMIIDPYINGVVAGANAGLGFELDLDDVEAFLNGTLYG